MKIKHAVVRVVDSTESKIAERYKNELTLNRIATSSRIAALNLIESNRNIESTDSMNRTTAPNRIEKISYQIKNIESNPN